MFITIIFVAVCLCVFLKYVFWRQKMCKTLPGIYFHPLSIFGNLKDLPYREASRNFHRLNTFVVQIGFGYAQLLKKEEFLCIWISFVPFIVIKKAEAVGMLLSDNKHLKKSWSYRFLEPWLGTGLLTSHGSKWKSRRKMLTPSFHFDILKDFLPVINEHAQILVRCLRREINKEFTNILTPITLTSLDIICETTMGVKIRASENSESQFVRSTLKMTDILMKRGINFFYWSDLIWSFTQLGKQHEYHLKILHDFTRSVIQEKKTKLLSGGDKTITKHKRKALIDVLLEQHIETKSLNEEDIREEVDTFTFEGHDTTSLGMTWALYLIGLHKDVQEKLHEELERIFGDDAERPASKEDLNDMKYLDCVLKESQRLYPSVPFFGREVTEDTQICGYTIPKGFSCFVISYLLHRDEDVFPNPEKFDPERFLLENSIGRHLYAYVPFSAGPRNCIGQRFAQLEEKVVVSTVLRNYTVESLDQRDKVAVTSELTLRPAVPIRLKIRPRK